MRAVARTVVVLLPFLLVLLAIRTCAVDEGDRWLDRVLPVDPAAKLAVNEPDLVVIAPDEAWGERVGREVVRFRSALIENYADLLGEGRDQRIAVVLFSRIDQLRAYAGRRDPFPSERFEHLHGYTAPSQGAVFLPPGSSLATARHETVHLLMAQGRGGEFELSPWLVEGLAQLFEAEPPGMSPENRAVLRRLVPGGIDVGRLLDLEDYSEFVEAEPVRNYVEALALTAFLFGERPQELLVRYIRRERSAAMGRPRVFREIYLPDEEGFRRDFRAFLGRMRGP